MSPEVFNIFCGDNDVREWINKPTRQGTDIVATNGHMVMAWHCADGAYETAPYRIDQLMESMNVVERHDTPIAIPSIPAGVCPDCKGKPDNSCQECNDRGYVYLSNSFNEYEVDCQSCEDGDNRGCRTCGGGLLERATIEHDGVFVNKKYIDKCLSSLAGCKFYFPVEKHKAIKVVHDNGYGYIMPMTEAYPVNHKI